MKRLNAGRAGVSVLRRDSEAVVLSGLGLVSPAGVGREATWSGIVSGESFTRAIVEAEGRTFPSGTIGARISAFPSLQSEDRSISFARYAAEEAWAHAQLPVPRDPNQHSLSPERMGCVIGVSKGGLGWLHDHWQSVRWSGPSTDHTPDNTASFWGSYPPNTAARTIAATFGIRGPVLCPVAACATGLLSVARGVELLHEGVADVVLAGSSDASIVPAAQATFRRMGVLAPRDADPATACRPFDRERRGFVLGEGAAVFVLERETDAVRRGVRPLARWLGHACLSDPTHLTRPEPDPRSLVRLIHETLRAAGRDAGQVDYLNLHGTATRANDVYESRAIRAAFGPAARDLPGSSQKGAIGHLLGGAGSVELALSVLAVERQLIPPTTNLHHPDPECPLHHVTGSPLSAPITTALKLSAGFGGHLAAALIERVAPTGTPDRK